jgi:molybdate transport system regulatory protein
MAASNPKKTPEPSRKAKTPPKSRTSDKGPALVPVWNLLLPDGDRLGEDRIRLLQAIEKTGSLLEAAALVGLSYRTAWSRVRELNTLFGTPLVESVQGGPEGGSTRLSAEAASLIALHRKATILFQRAAAEQGLESSDLHALESFQKRLTMRTSVRNQFVGRVRSVVRGKVHAEIALDLRGGASLVSQITISSCDALGLKPGTEAWALVKSTWVEIATGELPPRVSARNVLQGTVSSIRKGAVTDEICLTLPGGDSIMAAISSEALQGLGLRKGAKVWALFKASSVILAVN